jgi:hypothetical protein
MGFSIFLILLSLHYLHILYYLDFHPCSVSASSMTYTSFFLFFPRIFHSSYRCFVSQLHRIISIILICIIIIVIDIVFFYLPPIQFNHFCLPLHLLCFVHSLCSVYPVSYFLSVFLLLFGFLIFLLSLFSIFRDRTIIPTKSSFSLSPRLLLSLPLSNKLLFFFSIADTKCETRVLNSIIVFFIFQFISNPLIV